MLQNIDKCLQAAPVGYPTPEVVLADDRIGPVSETFVIDFAVIDDGTHSVSCTAIAFTWNSTLVTKDVLPSEDLGAGANCVFGSCLSIQSTLEGIFVVHRTERVRVRCQLGPR